MFRSKKFYLFGKVLITKKKKKKKDFKRSDFTKVWRGFHRSTATFILHNRSQVGCCGFNSVLRCTEINYSIPFALIYPRRNSQVCRKREEGEKGKLSTDWNNYIFLRKKKIEDKNRTILLITLILPLASIPFILQISRRWNLSRVSRVQVL